MKTYKFKVQKREETGKANADIYAEGLAGGVVYGPEIKENINIKMREADIRKLYQEAGESSIIDLEVEGEKEPLEVLIKDIVFDPVKMLINHVDFYKIKRGQKIEAAVSIDLSGEAPAVKALGGILVQTLDEVNIKCLPRHLMNEITLDISVLKTFDDAIYVRDLNLAEGIEVLNSGDDPIVSVSEPKEEKISESAPEAEMPEGEEKAEEGAAKPAEEKKE